MNAPLLLLLLLFVFAYLFFMTRSFPSKLPAIARNGLIPTQLDETHAYFDQMNTVLRHKVSLHHTPKLQNLPAPLFNGKLFVWGARITLVAPDRPFVELFALGSFFVRKKVKVVLKHKLRDTLLDDTELFQFPLLCRTVFDDAISQLKGKRNHNVDVNAVFFNIRLLCPIAYELLIQPTVLVEIISPSQHNASVFLEIPRHTHSIGLAGPNNTLSIPLHMQPKVKYMLCNGGGVQPNGLHLLPEYLQHHLRIGFQHIMVGIDDDMDGTLEARTRELIAPLIDAGVVVLYTFHTPRDFVEDIDKSSLAKNVFNEACLSYAKGRAAYVGNWDLDEVWMPPFVPPPSLGHASKSILETQLEAFGTTCKNWCYLSFPSYSLFEKAHGVKVDQIATILRWRDAKTNTVWKKSLARSSQTFNTGPHTFGNCLHPTLPSLETDGRTINKCDGGGISAPHVGVMHHFRAIFRGGRLAANKSMLAEDEYSAWTRREGFAVEVRRVIDDGRGVPTKFWFNRVPGEPALPYENLK